MGASAGPTLTVVQKRCTEGQGHVNFCCSRCVFFTSCACCVECERPPHLIFQGSSRGPAQAHRTEPEPIGSLTDIMENRVGTCKTSQTRLWSRLWQDASVNQRATHEKCLVIFPSIFVSFLVISLPPRYRNLADSGVRVGCISRRLNYKFCVVHVRRCHDIVFSGLPNQRCTFRLNNIAWISQ